MQINRAKIVESGEWLALYGYAVDAATGKDERIRWALGTKKQGEAHNRMGRLVRCVGEGITSSLWPTLKEELPSRTFKMLSDLMDYKPVTVARKVEPTWADLRASYIAALDAKILDGEFSESSKQNYSQSLKEFDSFVAARAISTVAQVTEDVVADFKLWRKKSILSKNNSGKECKRLSFDLTVLRAVWGHTNSKGWVKAGFSPVENPWPKMSKDNKPGAKPEESTKPFTALEIEKMRAAAETKTYEDSQGRVYKMEHGSDLLAFELLLRTGMRRCDASMLTWENVKGDNIVFKAQKNDAEIILPIHSALAALLRLEKTRRNPDESDTVLLNPKEGQPYDTMGRGLYRRMVALGKRVGVKDSRPHRFRCTFAVFGLQKGIKPIEIARLLGDTLDTVVKHYLPMSEALAQSTRDILEREDGVVAHELREVVSIGRKSQAA